MRTLAVTLPVAVGVFLWLLATSDPPLAHLDTSRDWLLARDCQVSDCPSWGTVASALGLRQGTLWIRVLSLGQDLGLGARGVQILVLALQALGAAVLAFGALALGAPPLRAAGLSLAYALLLRAVEPGDLLWNPVVAHPGAALFATGWTLLLVDGRRRHALLAGAGAALAVLGHVLGLVLLPLLALGAALGRTRPLVALPLAFGALLTLVGLDSADAAMVDARAFHAAGLALPMVGATAAAFLLGLPLRARWRRAGPGLRIPLALALALAVGLLAPALLPRYLGVADGVRFAYLVPPFATLSLVLGASTLLDRWKPRSGLPATIEPLGVLGLASLALGLGYRGWQSGDPAGPHAAWRLPELERLAADLYGRGETWPELFRRVQGPWDTFVIGHLAVLDPRPVPSPEPAPRGDPRDGLLVLRLARAAVPAPLPDGWRRVDVSSGHAALIRESPELLATDGLVVTWTPPGGQPRSATFDRRWQEAADRAPAFVDRFYPHAAPDAVCHDGGSAPARWRLPLGPSERPRRVLLPDPDWAGCTWRLLDDGGRPVADAVRIPAGGPALVQLDVEPRASWCRTCCSPAPLVVAPLDDPVVEAWRAPPGVVQ